MLFLSLAWEDCRLMRVNFQFSGMVSCNSAGLIICENLFYLQQIADCSRTTANLCYDAQIYHYWERYPSSDQNWWHNSICKTGGRKRPPRFTTTGELTLLYPQFFENCTCHSFLRFIYQYQKWMLLLVKQNKWSVWFLMCTTFTMFSVQIGFHFAEDDNILEIIVA